MRYKRALPETELGGLAQLVERFVRNEEVRSSNLLTSTNFQLVLAIHS